MAVEPGAIGGSGGGVGTVVPPPIGGGIAAAGGGLPNFPAILPNISLPAIAPTINRPDYAGILNQLMSPYEAAAAAQRAAFDRQMSALQDQVAHQRGFAEDAYGINKEGDQAAYDAWLKDFIAKLVGRGMFNSGAKNYYQNLQQKALARQLALLKNQLDSYLYGLSAQVTNARLAGEAQLASSSGQLAAQRAQLGMQLPYQYPATVTDPGSQGGPISGFYV